MMDCLQSFEVRYLFTEENKNFKATFSNFNFFLTIYYALTVLLGVRGNLTNSDHNKRKIRWLS